MGANQSSCGQCCVACCPCCGCCPCCVPSDDDEAKRILPKKIPSVYNTSGKKTTQDIDWNEMLNKKLLASGDVTHGAIIDVDDHENLKAGNFQPSVLGVKDLLSALLRNNTRAIDVHGISLSDDLPIYKPWLVDPYKAVYASAIDEERLDDGGEEKSWVCIAVRTNKHIVIAACKSRTITVQRHVLDVAKIIEKLQL